MSAVYIAHNSGVSDYRKSGISLPSSAGAGTAQTCDRAAALDITFALRASTGHSSVLKGAAEIYIFYTLQLFACGNEVTGLSLQSGMMCCSEMRVETVHRRGPVVT